MSDEQDDLTLDLEEVEERIHQLEHYLFLYDYEVDDLSYLRALRDRLLSEQ